MHLRSLCAAVAGVMLSLVPAAPTLAQCKDAWVTQAVQAIRKERGMPDKINGSGTTGECDINRYAGGSWKDYNDLLKKVRLSYICDDPWIGQALGTIDRNVYQSYRSTTGEEIRYAVLGGGKVGECNPKTYGSWRSYADLQRLVVEAGNKYQPGTCRDPWITQAITEYKQSKGKKGNDAKPFGWAENGECNMYLYAGGNWKDYNELKKLVTAKLAYLDKHGLSVQSNNTIRGRSGDVAVGDQLVFDYKGNVLLRPTDAAIRNSKLPENLKQDLLTTGTLANTIGKNGLAGIVSRDGAGLIGADGTTVVGHNGGAIVGNAGGNIVAAGAGNIIDLASGKIVAAGAGNIVAAGAGN